MPDPRDFFPQDPNPFGRDLFIGPDGRVHSNPWDAIAGGLSFEDTSSTGAGCSQSPDNVQPPSSPPKGKG